MTQASSTRTHTEQHMLSRELRRWLQQAGVMVGNQLVHIDEMTRDTFIQLMQLNHHRPPDDEDIAKIMAFHEYNTGKKLQFARFNTDLPLELVSVLGGSVRDARGGKYKVVNALPPEIKTLGQLADLPSSRLHRIIEGVYGVHTPLAVKALQKLIRKFF